MTSAGLTIATAVTFVWLGMVLAISFIEAPLKFTAPGVDLRIGLGIGRIVFRALNMDAPRSRTHVAYIGMEVLKVAALITVGAMLFAA